MDGMTFRFVFYDICTKFPIIGAPFLHAADMNQLKKLVKANKQYRISIICKAECIQELYDSTIRRYVYEIFTMNDSARNDIHDQKITIIEKNEEDLIFAVLCAAAQYTHRDKIRQQKLGNYGLSNTFSTDVSKLLEQIKYLL